jgi:hypothetical protein
MHKWSLLCLAGAIILSSEPASAADSTDGYFINQIAQGSPLALRDTAKSIYQGASRDRQVLDSLAEAMLQRAPTSSDNTSGDAVAWSCKALAQTGDKRYFTAVQQAADKAVHRGARKHCAKGAETLGSAQGEQYALGMTKLGANAAQPAGQAQAPAPKNEPAPAAQEPAGIPKGSPRAPEGGFQPITAVKKGMSIQQVYDMCGAPTNTTTYQTGKAFIPFNFRGKDNVRSAALYKGQGRVVFSNDSAYSGGMHVLEVLVNPNESGYP